MKSSLVKRLVEQVDTIALASHRSRTARKLDICTKHQAYKNIIVHTELATKNDYNVNVLKWRFTKLLRREPSRLWLRDEIGTYMMIRSAIKQIITQLSFDRAAS